MNPYESPAPSAGQRSGIGTVLLRVLAVGCWIASLLPVLAFLSIMNRPEIIERRVLNLPLFLAVNIAVVILPPWGLRSWVLRVGGDP